MGLRQAGRDLTRKPEQAGELLGLPVPDPLVLTGEDYFSFDEERMR